MTPDPNLGSQMVDKFVPVQLIGENDKQNRPRFIHVVEKEF